jgi:hypothetical protein
MRPGKEAYLRDGRALVLDVGEVYGRDSVSSIIVGASYSAACAWARWIGLDWTRLVVKGRAEKARASSARPYLGNRTWRYRYSLRACFSTFHLIINTRRICVLVFVVFPVQSYRSSVVVVFFHSSPVSSCRCGSVRHVSTEPTALRHRRCLLYLATTGSFVSLSLSGIVPRPAGCK